MLRQPPKLIPGKLCASSRIFMLNLECLASIQDRGEAHKPTYIRVWMKKKKANQHCKGSLAGCDTSFRNETGWRPSAESSLRKTARVRVNILMLCNDFNCFLNFFPLLISKTEVCIASVVIVQSAVISCSQTAIPGTQFVYIFPPLLSPLKEKY